MKPHLRWFLPLVLVIPLLTGCDKKADCPDCGGTLLEGYIFKRVTTDDLAKNDGLALIEDVDAGACIRAKLTGENLDLNTVTVVDDCCCE